MTVKSHVSFCIAAYLTFQLLNLISDARGIFITFILHCISKVHIHLFELIFRRRIGIAEIDRPYRRYPSAPASDFRCRIHPYPIPCVVLSPCGWPACKPAPITLSPSNCLCRRAGRYGLQHPRVNPRDSRDAEHAVQSTLQSPPGVP